MVLWYIWCFSFVAPAHSCPNWAPRFTQPCVLSSCMVLSITVACDRKSLKPPHAILSDFSTAQRRLYGTSFTNYGVATNHWSWWFLMVFGTPHWCLCKHHGTWGIHHAFTGTGTIALACAAQVLRRSGCAPFLCSFSWGKIWETYGNIYIYIWKYKFQDRMHFSYLKQASTGTSWWRQWTHVLHCMGKALLRTLWGLKADATYTASRQHAFPTHWPAKLWPICHQSMVNPTRSFHIIPCVPATQGGGQCALPVHSRCSKITEDPHWSSWRCPLALMILMWAAAFGIQVRPQVEKPVMAIEVQSYCEKLRTCILYKCTLSSDMKNANFGVPNSDRYQCWPRRKLPTAHLAAPPRATCMLQDFFGSGCSWIRITVGDAEVLVLPKSLAYVFSCWFEFATCHLAPIIRSSIRETCRPQYSAQDIAGIQMYESSVYWEWQWVLFPPQHVTTHTESMWHMWE